MSARIIPFDYQGQAVSFNAEGWLHATVIAERFGKRLDHWLDNAETLEYIRALDEIQHPTAGPSKIVNTRKSGYLKSRRGNAGGTWLHPKLAVTFARWCDAKFSVWCDMQIEALIHGSQDWQQARHQSAIGYRGLCEALAIAHEERGTAPQRHHFINEAKLINQVITGQFAGRNRDELNAHELLLVTLIEIRDVLLIGQGKDFAARKASLLRYVQSLTAKHLRSDAA
ncbi:KilA-N domain-containing protein [Pseudomonas sp. PICF6]|uniref:KilA-N domain-containing protein n=1 Tax=Pseudomonas sp. PICF6 TaxID=2664172 RepID=UPI00136CA387|nr:KilA-N domain-containing protein [Pseudomonas sp. PICF6]MXR31989.1 KilA-N domain-containing protein [Pseudomonas sp. PICF6]